MASYPASVKSFSAISDNDVITDEMWEEAYDEITAMQTALLTDGLAHIVKPSADSTYDLGVSGTGWRDLFVSRNATIGGTLGVTGVATFDAQPVFSAGIDFAGQLAFPATQSASADVNTLDDYEEGTWTPGIGGSGGESGQAYTTQSGQYIKVGKLVLATFSLHISTEGTITTSAEITGLPFAIENPTNGHWCAIQWRDLATNWVSVGCQMGQGSTTQRAQLQGSTAAAISNITALTSADIQNGTRFFGTLIYRASA